MKLSPFGKKAAVEASALISRERSRSILSAPVPRKPVADAVAECLKEEGFDHGRGELSYEAVARAIAPCMRRRLKKPYQTASEMEALTKAVLRHFSGPRK